MSRHALIALCATLIALLAASCSGIEPEYPVDEEGNRIPTPPPAERWLRIASIEPATSPTAISLRPTLAARFDQYIDPDSFVSFSAVGLRSGGIAASGSLTYQMTYRRMVWRPYSSLIDGIEYDFALTLLGLYSVTGSPRLPSDQPQLYLLATSEQGATTGRRDQPPTDPVYWPEVLDLLTEKGCYTCHGDEERWPLLHDLSYEALLHRPSDEVDFPLVRPFDAPRSYLMHKLLPDYPIRRHTVQPPPWAPEPYNQPLSRDEIWVVERFIEGGALQAPD